MHKHWSIKVLAPLLFGLPVLAVGLGLSLLWHRQSQRAVTDLADQNMRQIHDMVANKVDTVLSVPVRVCRVNEHLIQSGALDPERLETWRETLVRENEAFDTLSAIAWGGADGRAAWVSRYADGSYYWAIKQDPQSATMDEWRIGKDGSIAERPTNSFPLDVTSRPWFQTPRDAKRAMWSAPYVWVGGVDSQEKTLGISYGIPLFQADGELLGVVDADYSLNDLSYFLSSLRIGKTGVALLATPDGKLVASSSATPVVMPGGKRLDAATSADPRIAAAAHIARQGEEPAARHAEIDIDGEAHYLRASAIGRELGLDWTLVTIVPEKDFVEQIDAEFQRSFLISLLAVALAIGVGLVAANWLVSPLLRLVAAVRRIAQGDLQTQVHVRHAREYVNLAEEINKMTVGLQDRMRMQKSLSLAMEVQRNLLPDDAPQVKGLDIAGHSTYCDETGGDYYDFLDVSDVEKDTAVVAIGDVMGHGVAAALLMATARGILRSRCAESGSLADLLNHLNDMMVADTRGERFMAMLLVTISAQSGQLRWSSAGHGPPLVFDPAGHSFLEIDGGGLPLGLVEGEQYQEYTQPGIKPGSIILATTDGLAETMNPQGEIYGLPRLHELLRVHGKKSAEEISQAIRESLAKYRGPVAQDDDLTFVVVKVR